MADIKISQLTAKGATIASTDLIEISESDGQGGYVTKSVTGANVLSTKQNTLVSGTNIKTINSTTLLGAGDVAVQPTLVSGTNIKTVNSATLLGSGDIPVQATLVSGTNIKTINSTTILGSGDLPVQDTLVSGTNIKTIENQSLLGAGNIDLGKSDVGLGNVDNTSDVNKPISTATQTALNNKQNTIVNSDSITEGSTNLFLTSAERTKLVNTSGTNTGDQTNISGTANNVTGIVAVANGGTGTATPSLVAGTNVTISGTFPNQTINAAGGGGGGGTEIGALIGGGVVAAVFNEGGVNKALVVSLTNLGNVPYTISAFQSILIGATAQSFFNGLTNTNAIIAQTGVPATTAYAAGLARLFAGGGYNDWYLPSIYELHVLFNTAALTSRATGVTAFDAGYAYFSSTEASATQCYALPFNSGTTNAVYGKSFGGLTRAVRIHTI